MRSDMELPPDVEATTPPEICHWEDAPDGFRFYMPACTGGAVHGPDSCNCEKPLSLADQNWHDKYRAVAKRLQHSNDQLNWARSQLRKAGLSQYPKVGEIK